jgi:predicted TIM-barrel fold metal-dependent hydrolase
VLIDAYAHLGRERFLGIEDYRAVMAATGIERAVLCAFDSCPDLPALHQALQQWPDTFRAVGVPLGHDLTERQAAAEAQLSAGFSGLRLTEQNVLEEPYLLQALGRHGAVALVCGRLATTEVASVLLAHLERHSRAVVVGGHFGGVTGPDVLRDGPVRELFEHPRFRVTFSRHGGYRDAEVTPWAEAVLARVGWERVMWGSEAPVLFWRNETMPGALAWVDRLRPTPTQRADFLAGTAERLYFGSAVDGRAPLSLPFEPRQRAVPRPAPMFQHGMTVDQRLAGRLVHAWLAQGGGTDGVPLHTWLQRFLDDVLPELPELPDDDGRS